MGPTKQLSRRRCCSSVSTISFLVRRNPVKPTERTVEPLPPKLPLPSERHHDYRQHGDQPSFSMATTPSLYTSTPVCCALSRVRSGVVTHARQIVDFGA